MLAKANRITSGSDYRNTVRRGSRFTAANTVTYIRSSSSTSVDVRFGFIVAKSVGHATVRNLVRRRLKAVAHELLPLMKPGVDVVVRALPGSALAPWTTLQEEISRAVNKVGAR